MRTRFWIETASAVLCGVLCVVTFVWADWIELAFRVSPDNGDGSLEWAIAAVFLALSVVLAAGAYVESVRSARPSLGGRRTAA